MIYYRIHAGDESPETVLDPRRPDGWVASDEEYETQPYGVSACADLDDLRAYIEYYSLTVQPGDVVLEMRGYTSHEHDRDLYALRVVVESVRVLGPAEEILAEPDEELDT